MNLKVSVSVDGEDRDKIIVAETHRILWVWHCVKRPESHGKLVNYEVIGVIHRLDKTTKSLLVLCTEKN